MQYVLAVLMGYILGSSNMAYYIAKIKKADLRSAGSGNLGASNAVVLLGWKAGVLTAVHEKSPFAKAGADAYSIWIAVCTIVIAAVALLFLRKKKTEKPYSWRAGGVCAIQGVLGRVANFLLVVAQANKVDTSVQYSMVTGGVMVVSTLICFFGANKPGKREVISVVLAFLGMVALFAIPF